MEKININLAIFEYDDKRISYPLLMGAALIILIISGLSVHLFLNNQIDIKEYEKNIVRLGQENITLKSNNTPIYQKLDSVEIETIHKEIDLINELIIKDIFPWDKLISNLERDMPAGIKLLDLTMSDDLSKLKLQCKAVSVRDISSFLTQLNSSKIYRNNNLLNLSVAQENVLQESQKGENLVITFEIESSVVKDQLFTN
ncbi:MAG: PilN domain-containing protein [Candidatus Thorarchaeota archaeon]